MRHVRHPRSTACITLLLFLLTCGGWHPGVAGETFPGDKQALLSVFESLSSRGDLTSSWSLATDPCDDGWVCLWGVEGKPTCVLLYYMHKNTLEYMYKEMIVCPQLIG